MKNHLVFFALLPFLILSACQENNLSSESPPDLYSPPKKVKLNLQGGYITNQFNGDTIKPIINYTGDTIISGKAFKIKGKVINPDSTAKPISQPIPSQSELVKKTAKPNISYLKPPIKKVLVDESIVEINTIPDIEKGDKNHIIINSIGDTIQTGIPQNTNGKTVTASFQKAVKASPPRFKDNANYNLQYLDVDQGLSSSYIYSTLEDSNGNLWLATFGAGISRYDGTNFNHFTKKEGLSDDIVRCMLEDKNGNLWFGTDDGGVCRFDGINFTHLTEKEGLSNNTVLSLYEDKKGIIWIGTYGGGLIRFDGEKITTYTTSEGLSGNTVYAIQEDDEERLWIGTFDGLNSFDGSSFKHFTTKNGLSSNKISSLSKDKKGNLWIGTFRGGLNKFDGKEFTHYTKENGFTDHIILSLTIDSEDKLWIGTYDDGVISFDGKRFTKFSKDEGLSNDIIRSVTVSKEGILWFGTDGGGVCKYNENSFEHFTKEKGLSENLVMSILEDRNENLWFGTFGGGLNRYNNEYVTHYKQKDNLASIQIFSILEDKPGNLWIGLWKRGVNKFNGSAFINYTTKQGLSGNDVISIVEDQNQKLWFGTFDNGLNSFDGKVFTHYTQKEGIPINRLTSIIEDQKGNIWFGTDGGGLCKYHGNQLTIFTEKEGLSNNQITCLYEDKNGNIWIGTDGSGLDCFDGKKVTNYSQREGLTNNLIWSIVEDEVGNIWVSTENGLNLLSLNVDQNGKSSYGRNASKFNIHSYSKNDGLKGLDFMANSVLKDSKNQIWWGSGKSLTKLDLNNFELAQESPKVYLRELGVNEDFIDFRHLSDTLEKTINFSEVVKFENYPKDLKLAFENNHLSFHFSAIDMTAPHKLKYSYKVDGLNENWSQPTAETKADYRNLPYGDFTFKVKAIGASGEWSEALEYKFYIHPPWWHTWWARLGYFLVAVIAISSFIKWRTTSLKARQKELEGEVKQATKEIREQKEEVEEAHREIQDSISYAKRIQSAILPPKKIIKKHLPESFILYKPKDIVAGDFYWMEHQKDKVLIAAADCTGHGVPGAMVSVVCNNGLNRSVREYKLKKPGEILNKTREIVIQEFEKSEEEVKDGMDISICSIDVKNKNIQWAGANNPIWLINPNRKKWPKGFIPFKNLEGGAELKAVKQAIGKVDSPLPFKTHEFTLEEGDIIYLFSDGYQDQFGGEMGKKLKAINFKKFLLSISNKPLVEQGNSLDVFFEDWRGKNEQVDDVCVIGFKI